MRLACALLVFSAASCGPSSSEMQGGGGEALRGLPPRHDAPYDLSDEDDLGRARIQFDAMAVDDPSRAAKRHELWLAYQSRASSQIGESRDRAFGAFETGLELWTPQEIAGGAADLQQVGQLADVIYKTFSASGNDEEALTALAALQAARPNRAAELDATFKDIRAYDDDLDVAANGAGAERTQIVLSLEKVLEHFPSPWVGRTLLKLVDERQAAIVADMKVAGQQDRIIAHQHDPAAALPRFTLIRIFARLGRLSEAGPAVAALAGQFGDDAQIEQVLGAALAAGAKPADWFALAAVYQQTDPGAALAICEEASRHLPKDVDAAVCVAQLAATMRRIGVALRWADRARELGPDDHDALDIWIRLRVGQMSDDLTGERVDAAKKEMDGLQAAIAHAAKLPKKLDFGQADADVAMGEGLYRLGEVDDAMVYLKRALAAGPNPDASAAIATIEDKLGRHLAAARDFERANDLPRPELGPREIRIAQAGLRRLAGEAYADAGEHGKALVLFRKAIDDWKELLDVEHPHEGPNPEIALGLAEMARLESDAGDNVQAVQFFDAAISADPSSGNLADFVAYMWSHGNYDDALDASHRAVSNADVGDYFKVYTALWMYDAAKLKGLEPDRIIAAYLAKSARKENRWYYDLARFATGAMTFEQLLAKADTRGRRAEAYFYGAMAKYAAHDDAAGHRMLEDVIATQMLGLLRVRHGRDLPREGSAALSSRRARVRDRSARRDRGVRAPRAAAPRQAVNRFPHGAPAHVGLACTECHAAEDVLAGRPARPGVADHAPCESRRLPRAGVRRRAGSAVQGLPRRGRAVARGRDDAGPYPPPTGPIALASSFSHATHLDAGKMEKDVGFHVGCADCHTPAPEGGRMQLPDHAACARCHDKLLAACGSCHVPRADEPHADRRWIVGDLRFEHASHVTDAHGDAIPCATCHASVATSTRGQGDAHPGTIVCAGCHDDAKRTPKTAAISACATCHSQPLSTLSRLVAPRSHLLSGFLPDNHTLAFRRDHAREAEADAASCARCHTGMSGEGRDNCDECHRTMRPRNHMISWAELDHGPEAATDAQRCATCHEAEFCVDCHSHPPRSHDATFMRSGHGGLARENLRSCLTCHQEPTCAQCHPGGAL